MLPTGSVVQATLGDREIALCRTAEGVYALDGACPHRNGPLGHGALHGYAVVCPWHAWEFDCRTGIHPDNPAVRVRTYPVVIQDGDILVELP